MAYSKKISAHIFFALLIAAFCAFGHSNAARATESGMTKEQIDLAQSFYEFCADDYYMKQNYECRCLAAEFIDAYIGLGDQATQTEAFKIVKNKCILPGGALAADEKLGQQADHEEIDEKLKKEALQVQSDCFANKTKSGLYDCSCIGAQYLAMRINKPEHSPASVLQDATNKCPNDAGLAGPVYQNCLANAGNGPPNKDPEEYCKCLANSMARSFRSNPTALTSYRGTINMQADASARCRQ